MVSMEWVFFDLNGTLLDPSGMAQELGGGDEERRLVQGAFQEALLHAMADTLSGGYRPLSEHLRAALDRWLFVSGHETKALEPMMRRADAMDPFPDAEQALKRLGDAGLHVAVLTNSSAQSARSSLERAGLLDGVAAVIGSEEVRVYKPHPMVYRHGVEHVGVAPEKCYMVAAHGWDLMGLRKSGCAPHGSLTSSSASQPRFPSQAFVPTTLPVQRTRSSTSSATCGDDVTVERMLQDLVSSSRLSAAVSSTRGSYSRSLEDLHRDRAAHVPRSAEGQDASAKAGARNLVSHVESCSPMPRPMPPPLRPARHKQTRREPRASPPPTRTLLPPQHPLRRLSGASRLGEG